MTHARKLIIRGSIACIVVAMLFGVFAFAPDVALAQGDFGLQSVEDQGIGLSNQPLDVTIMKFIRIALGFLGLIAVVIVMYGGYTYMTAAGNEDKVARGKLILRNGVIGLAIILFSFIIVQFIIKQLMDVTGLNDKFPTECTDVVGCNGGSCFLNTFGVQSITPSQDATGMNNIVIRAVFSKGVGTPAEQALTISLGVLPGNLEDLTDKFTYTFVEDSGRRIIEAVYTFEDGGLTNCNASDYEVGTACIPVDVGQRPYHVEINDNLVAIDGQGIAFGEVCDDFNSIKKIDFTVDQEVNDIVPPSIDTLGVVDPNTNEVYTEVPAYLIAAREYTFLTDVDDDNGIGYVHLNIEANEDSSDSFDIYRGPPAGASSADPYTLTENVFFSGGITKKWGAPKEYTLTATVWDIDHNSTVATSSFVLYGAHCDNGKQDNGETGIDEGGACGKGPKQSCTSDIECASGKCIDSFCAAFPKITDVDPMDGAPGNWVTVLGNYFGFEEGTIEFGSEEAGWIKANLVECPGIVDGDTWHDSFAIVEVPEPVLEPNIEVNGAVTLDGSGYINLTPQDDGPDGNGWTFGTWVQLAHVDLDEEQPIMSVGEVSNYLKLSFTDEKKIALSHIENGTVTSSVSGLATNLFDNQAWVFVSVGERPSDGAKIVHINNDQYFFSMEFQKLNFDSVVQPFIHLGHAPSAPQTIVASYDEAILVPSYAIAANLYTQISASVIDGPSGSAGYMDTILELSPTTTWYWRLGDASVTNLKEEMSGSSNGGSVKGNASMQTDGIFGSSSGTTSATEVAIRITTADGVYSDTTVDLYGPQPGDKDGLFIYNDIERPGLCAVVVDGDQADVNDGDLAGPPGTNIRAHGAGFGTQEGGDQLLFSIAAQGGNTLIAGETTDWTEQLIRSIIPINFSPGAPLVRVKKDGESSNGIPFVVTEADLSDVKPLITDIDPGDPTPGSFVTIYGNNFGVAGVVYISKQKGATCSFKSDTDGCVELKMPGEPCLNTWSNTQIIVDIEETFIDFGTYYVIVERADNHLQSDGLVDIMSIQDGPPKPSICELSPVQGPAPLPDDSPRLTFTGKNFSTEPVLYFWNGSQTYTSSTKEEGLDNGAWISWNGSAELDENGEKKYWSVDNSGTQIISSVGYDLGGSMPLGQWPITIEAKVETFDSVNNTTDVHYEQGNSVKYFVTDCREEEVSTNKNLHCCTDGKDAGSWKQICDGEVRNSGYVYRFTTAILADAPYVLNQCDELNWYSNDYNTDGYDGKNPSPVPSTQWEESENMCLNATVQVAFSMGLDKTTISTDSVFVYECGSTKDDIDCTYDDDDLLTNLDLIYEPGGVEPLLIIKQGNLTGPPNFASNTWHRVVLTTDITSGEQGTGAGTTSTEPLRIDDKLVDSHELDDFNKGTPAFYYDFETGTTFCSLSGAFITPKEKTATKLGLIMDYWYPDLPFYYYLKGLADTKCTVLNVDNMGWDWTTNKPDSATIDLAPDTPISINTPDGVIIKPPLYTDTRATAEAKLHTPELLGGVTFDAQSEPTTTLEISFPPDGVIVANSSTLFINLGKPRVVYYEPNCSEACPNGIILAEFNRHVDPLTFTKDTIILSQCNDPNCLTSTPVDDYEFVNKDSLDPNDWLYVKIKPKNSLENDEFYKVELNSGIKSLGKLIPGAHDDGELEYKEWIFRTKSDGTLCAVDHVGVDPNPFVATYIGQKTKFAATPYGAPSECSATGQELGMWDYEYQWSSTEPLVAEVTTFEKSLSTKNYCTQTCLQKGSDVSFGYKEKALCGNRIVDAGEDCDINTAGEKVGVSCTLSCLRPGVTTSECGNGKVDNIYSTDANAVGLGELCDPEKTTADGTSWTEFCSNSCLLKGSSDTFDPAISGFCGDGKIGLEESCDIALDPEDTPDNLALSKTGCNISCLHSGTSLATEWCENTSLVATAIAQGGVTAVQVANACNTAQSVCGNGNLELGEQCERTAAVNAGDGKGPYNVSDEFCSDSCLFYDGDLTDNEEDGGQIGICGTQYEQCDAADEECTEHCTYAGSSLSHSTPSLCGDGFDGIGEEKTPSGDLVCEVPGQVSIDSLTQSPLQLATAIGEGIVTTGTQKTSLEVRMPGQSTDVKGIVDYTLQCGFTEFDEIQSGLYNDCEVPLDGDLATNALGVGYNSCCYLRPVRVSEYPVGGAGFANEEPVCRNTYIEVTFDRAIDPVTITDNAIVARGYETFENCGAFGGVDVTNGVNEALDLASGVVDAAPKGFWAGLWHNVKSFFLRLIGRDVLAKDILLTNIKTWCTSDVVLTSELSEPAATVPLYISNILGEDNVHTAYAVLLEGGRAGITDVAGVGIKHKTKAITHDAWAFEVGTKICKIEEVVVDPASHLFAQPSTSTDFGAGAKTDTGQLIVPTPPYMWSWAWQPQLSSIFDIPAVGSPGDSQFTKLGSTNVEGTLTAVAQAIVSADKSTENNHTNKIFEGTTQLTSMFCEHPWPAILPNGEWTPYTNDTYQFSFSYCSDAGQSGVKEDDLPFIDGKPIDIVFGGSCSVTGGSCTVGADCTQTFDLDLGSYVGESTKNGICEFEYEGAQWQPLQDLDQNGTAGTVYYGLGCNEDSECQDESRYLDETIGAYYPLLLPSVDVSTLDLSENIAQATCNTSLPQKTQECVGFAAGSLEKTLFVSETNNNGIGIQIFENPNRLSAAEWFADRFPNATLPQQITIAGYDAVADQDNYYVNSLNVIRDENGIVTSVYSNIYLFSISQNAQASTRDVFDQIIDSLAFNTNISDHGYCIGYDDETPDYENACTTDFDCILGLNEVVIADEEIGICSIDDTGAWVQESLPTTKSIYSMTFRNNIGWAGGHGGTIVKTLNGGIDWSLLYEGDADIFDPGNVFYDLQFLDDNNGWGAIKTIAKTTDGGAQWEKVDSASGISSLFRSRAVHFVSTQQGVVVGTMLGPNGAGTIYTTSDGGDTWSKATEDTYTGVLTDVAFVNASVGIAVGTGGKIMRTLDGGKSWASIQSGTTSALNAVTFFNSLGWIVGSGGTVLYTEDAGKTWTIQDSGTTATLSDVVFTSGSNGFVVHGQGGTLQTKNGGGTWNVITTSISWLDGNAINVAGVVGSTRYAAGQYGLFLRSTTASNDTCVQDSDCQSNNVCLGSTPANVVNYSSLGCHAEQTKLLRDWDRLHDVRNIQVAIQNGTMPQLTEGTFRKNYVSSVWPSWGAFGNQVGQNLPQDPINTWDGCNPADPQTCWDATDSAFICPEDASVYEYMYDKDTIGYSLHIPMEFFTDESFVEDSFSSSWIDTDVNTPFVVDPFAFTTERSCVAGQSYKFVTSQCGDGVVSPSEQCDPPGKTSLSKKGAVVQTYGVCEYQNDIACLYQTDCPYYKSLHLGGGNYQTMYTSGNAGKHCEVKKNDTWYWVVDETNSDQATDTYNLFGCSTDNDCTDSSLYDGHDISIHSSVVFYEQDPEFVSEVLTSQEMLALINTDTVRCAEPLQGFFSGQQCDGGIPGAGPLACPSSPVQEYATRTCNDTCQWNYGECAPINECGNGIVDQGEACDDGTLNGAYGHCAGAGPTVTVAVRTNKSCNVDSDCNDENECNIDRCIGGTCDFSAEIVQDCVAADACQELHYQSCGNGIIDYDISGNALEFCEQTDELHMVYTLDEGKMRIAAPEQVLLYSTAQEFVSDTCQGNVLCSIFVGFFALDLINQVDQMYTASKFLKVCSIDTRLLCATDADCIAPNDSNVLFIDNLTADAFSLDVYLTEETQNFGTCVSVGGNLGTPYSTSKEQSCRWDCQGYGSYCGDGFINLNDGEECEDGNSDNWDGCSSSCHFEDISCKQLQPHYSVDTDEHKTYVYISEGNYTNFADFGGSMIESCFQDTASYICQTFDGMSCLDLEVSDSDGEFQPFQDSDPCDGNLLQAIYGAYPDSEPAYRIVCDGEFAGYPTEEVSLCGNGVTNAGETCDDGNSTDGDGCSASCFIEDGCGNGIRDFNDKNKNGVHDKEQGEEFTEQCDLSVFGTQSFADCEASLGYGDPACTYCTEQCLIEVKEPPGACGDGIFDVIDTNQYGEPVYEACEFNGAGEIQLDGQVVASCKDAGLGEFGPIACTNSCTIIDDSSCYSCGPKYNGAVANVSLLNAMVGQSAEWNYPISARFQKKSLTGEIETLGIMNISDNAVASDIYNHWIVPNYNKGSFIDLTTTTESQLRVEANLDCSATDCFGESCGSSGYQVAFGPEKFENQDIYEIPGNHVFSYQVTGEKFAVSNEYIISPPVPEGVMRVVVRWESDQVTDGDLRGGFYSKSKFGGNQEVLSPGAFTGDWCTEITGGQNLKDAYDGYGWPGGPSCQNTNDVIWPHDVVLGETNSIQAFTIDLNELSMNSEPVAFFVQSTGIIPLGAHTSKKIFVDVYVYNAGYQETYYTSYYPDFTYEINTSVQGISNPYAGAQNWHVFNIIPDDPADPTDGLSDESEGAVAEEIPGVDMWLVPVEDMQVDDCAIKEQVYPTDINICATS